MNVVAKSESHNIARPLKVLIPLIQSELQQGNNAGREHYVQAGKMLLEAKDQVPHGRWSTWLAVNFELVQRTAQKYMQMARMDEQMRTIGSYSEMPNSIREMTGQSEREREQRQSTQHQAFKKVLRDVARDEFIQERQTRNDEIQLHRDLAEELIDIGYRALATKLHPDRGGTRDAMARLNRVRGELKQIAQTRRFV